MYIHIYIHTHTYVFTFLCASIYIYTNIHIYTHTYIHTYIHIHVYIYIHAHMCMYTVHTCIYAFMEFGVQGIGKWPLADQRPGSPQRQPPKLGGAQRALGCGPGPREPKLGPQETTYKHKDLNVVWYGMAWHGMAWHGMAWHGMAWHGMVWYGYSIK